MTGNARDDQAFVSALEAVPLPQADTPLFKAELKAKLLAEAARRAQPVRPARPTAVVGHPWWRYALVAAALLVVLAWQMLPAPLPAFACLEIEVNPGVRLTLNVRGQVIGMEPLDDAAALALGELDVRRRTTAEVVVQILERLHGAALLDATSRVWLVASPVGEAQAEEIERLLTAAKEAVNTTTQRLLAQAPAAQGLVIDRERYEIAKQAALRPSQYLRVARAGVSAAGMKELVAAGARLQATGKLAGNRLRELAELIAELIELGLPEGEAVQLIETLLAEEQSIERLTKRIEKAVERVEEGQALKDAVRELREGKDQIDERDDAEDDEDDDQDKPEDRGQGRDGKRDRGDEGDEPEPRLGEEGGDKEAPRRDGEDEDEGN
jgi:DNA repair protein RadC